MFYLLNYTGGMKVSFRQEKGKGFVSTVDGRETLTIDDHYANRPEIYSPTELLLFAAGTCSGPDVLGILEKMKQQLDRYECEVTGERMAEFPKIFKYVNVHYKAWGNVKPEALKKAANLSLSKYCHVGITLARAGIDVTYSYSVNGQKIEEFLHPVQEE